MSERKGWAGGVERKQGKRWGGGCFFIRQQYVLLSEIAYCIVCIPYTPVHGHMQCRGTQGCCLGVQRKEVVWKRIHFSTAVSGSPAILRT